MGMADPFFEAIKSKFHHFADYKFEALGSI
jgi:hypothetical protein